MHSRHGFGGWRLAAGENVHGSDIKMMPPDGEIKLHLRLAASEIKHGKVASIQRMWWSRREEPTFVAVLVHGSCRSLVVQIFIRAPKHRRPLSHTWLHLCLPRGLNRDKQVNAYTKASAINQLQHC